MHTIVDPSSQSNFAQAKVNSLKLVLDVNFKDSCLTGHVVVRSVLQTDHVEHLILDTNHLEITNVTDEHNNNVTYKLGAHHEVFGTPLIIDIPVASRGATKEFNVLVHYSTTQQSGALQWLTPEQTAGKKHPYLLSQCQAIHARSVVPCQDSPANKITYSADITVEAPLIALMSAIATGETKKGDKTTYSFSQSIPIPTYLIAIVAAHLESREIGPRSRVWSEPSVVDAAAYEFANTEKFIAAGEDLLTPYVWKRYDLLLLPPSFPYGGMENPTLTFLTPTLLAGDRTLENVVAHEIAHSWCGNLVTNAMWSEFFLNEGFTVFVERKIIGRLYGNEMFSFEAINGLRHLTDDIPKFKPELTALRPNLDGIDPDDAFSSVPYEKGFNLLCYLEGLVGVEAFEAWLKAYITKFSYLSITADQMKQFFIDYFTEAGKGEAINVVDWDAWFNNPGLPHNQVEFVSPLGEKAKELAQQWVDTKGEGMDTAPFKSFCSQQIILFLDTLLTLTKGNPLPLEVIEKMDSLYELSGTRNAEYRAKWYSLCLNHKLERIEPKVVDFLVEQGRMKFVRPLYSELNKRNPELAKDTFTKHRCIYHSIASKMVAKDLGINN
eukprot:gene6777-7877_t